MSSPIAMPDRGRLPLGVRLTALLAVGIARLLSGLPPRRLRSALLWLRRSAKPATISQARDARRAVVAVSALCAGEGCLPRSLAAAVLCRMRGVWPTWCTGVRTAPFAAHAWIQVDEELVEEPYPPGYHTTIITVPPLP